MGETRHSIFDRETGGFKPFKPVQRLTLLDQLTLEHAIRSLDADKIKDLWRKHNIFPPGDMSSLLFWGTVHTTRFNLVHATPAERAESETWLRRNGFDVQQLTPKVVA